MRVTRSLFTLLTLAMLGGCGASAGSQLDAPGLDIPGPKAESADAGELPDAGFTAEPDAEPPPPDAEPPPVADAEAPAEEPTHEGPLYQSYIDQHLAKQLQQVRAIGAVAFVDLFAYPPDLAMPLGLQTFVLDVPFASGEWVRCQQSNNNLYYGSTGASHGPDKALRYSLDFNRPRLPEHLTAELVAAGIDTEGAGMPVTAVGPGTAYAYGGARPILPGVFYSDGREMDNGGLGNLVAVDHGNGFATIYAHLDRIDIKTGDLVNVGDALGTMGRTGGSGAVAHLHFQVHRLLAQPNPAEAALSPQMFNYSYAKTFGVTVPFRMRVKRLVSDTQVIEQIVDSRFFETDFYGLLSPLTMPERTFWYGAR